MTPAERQAKRREQFFRMRDALEQIQHVTKASDAREIASAVLNTIRPKDAAKP